MTRPEAMRDELDELLSVIEAQGFPLGRYLGPGLTREEIDSLWHAFPLPQEIYELYQWRNGQSEECPLPLFRDQMFLPFEEALQHHAMFSQFHEGMSADEVGVDLGTSFPFAGFQGSYWVLPSSPQTLVRGHERPVVEAFEGVEPVFHSFRAMLKVLLAWFREGAVRVTASGDSETDESRAKEIWEKHNPGIFGA